MWYRSSHLPLTRRGKWANFLKLSKHPCKCRQCCLVTLRLRVYVTRAAFLSTWRNDDITLSFPSHGGIWLHFRGPRGLQREIQAQKGGSFCRPLIRPDKFCFGLVNAFGHLKCNFVGLGRWKTMNFSAAANSLNILSRVFFFRFVLAVPFLRAGLTHDCMERIRKKVC